jgi:hypothetical protein
MGYLLLIPRSKWLSGGGIESDQVVKDPVCIGVPSLAEVKTVHGYARALFVRGVLSGQCVPGFNIYL